MEANNDGSDDRDRDDTDNRDEHDDNNSNDDDNNIADDCNNDGDDIENINDDNEYKCTHTRLHIHVRALAHSQTGTFARLHTLINLATFLVPWLYRFYTQKGAVVGTCSARDCQCLQANRQIGFQIIRPSV